MYNTIYLITEFRNIYYNYPKYNTMYRVVLIIDTFVQIPWVRDIYNCKFFSHATLPGSFKSNKQFVI